VEPLLVLFGGALAWTSAWGLGRLLLARCGVVLRREEVAAVAFLTGSALLSLAVFLLAAVKLAYPAVFLVLGLASATCLRLMGRPFRLPPGETPRVGSRPGWLALPFLAFCVYYLCHAMAPEASPDGAAYHLGLVSRYLREHGLVRITTSMYASLSQGLEMLFLFAFAFGKHSAAALVHLAFLPALAWLMWCWGRRAHLELAAGCGALLVLASPIVGLDAASAYNDVALAAIAFAVFFLLDVWDRERQPGLLVAIGLLAGFAYAVKYTGALAIPYAIGFVLWRERRVRPAILVALAAALPVVPWLVKNALWAGNPFAPFFNDWFPNPYVTAAFEREYKEMLALNGLQSRWELPWQVTTRGLLSGLLGPVFLLAPGALLALRRAEGRRLLAAALVFSATYFTNTGARFLIPPLPFVAIAMMLALSAAPRLAIGIALLHAVISWPSVVPRYCDPGAWRFGPFPWRDALGRRDPDLYLERRLSHYGVTRLVERATAPGSSVLTFTPIPQAYTSRTIRVVYESTANKIAGALLWTPLVPEYAPTWRLRFSFPPRPLGGVRVVQTGSGTRDLWNIHELRLYDGGQELARDPGWRLTAHPYPWTVQDAFDNSLLTFWMCGEWIRPGQYVEVDFARAEQVSAVVVETAPDQAGVRLKLEGKDAAGKWIPLAAAPGIRDAPRPLRLRRAAAEELKRRGVDYLVVFDSDVGAGDLRRNPDLWGMRLVGQYEQARLYQLP
jgi:hypothetical protein